MDVKNSACEGSERSGDPFPGKESPYCLGEYTNYHKQIVGRNLDIKGATSVDSEGNEEHIFGNWRKKNLWYKAAKSLSELCRTVLWKAELLNNECRYLAAIPKQDVQGTAFCEARTVKKNEQDLLIWEILSLSRWQKMLNLGDLLLGKLCSGEKAKGVTGQTLVSAWDHKSDTYR